MAITVALVGSLWHVCVGRGAEQSVVCGCRHMSQCLVTHGGAHAQLLQGCCTNRGHTHLREGATKVVGVRKLKAADLIVLAKWQRGQQAHELVVAQLPAAGLRLDGGQWWCCSRAGQDTKLITPTPPPLLTCCSTSSSRTASQGLCPPGSGVPSSCSAQRAQRSYTRRGAEPRGSS